VIALVVGIVVAVAVVNGIDAVDGTPTTAPVATLIAGVYTAAGVEIADGSTLPAVGFSPIVVRDAASGIRRVKCSMDGAYLGSDNNAPFTFDVASPAIGAHKLRCTLQNDADAGNGFSVRFTVAAGSIPTPSNTVGPTGPADSASQTETSQTQTSQTQTSETVSSQANPASPANTNVVVTDAVSLEKALAEARPGTTITLNDGNYNGADVKDPSGKEPGRFVAAVSGTAAAPIVLQGSPQAILDGGGTGGGYSLHLVGANYWKLLGFTVQSASKGIVLDRSNHTVIDGVHVTDIGAEGIHFRAFSSDNLLTNSRVENTGVRAPNFGEGVYIGSAQSNWGTYTGGEPDHSDRNQIIGNTITDTAAENIDIKEGSSDGVVRGNYLGGDKIASKNSADSWVDVKGNGYVIDANHGYTTPRPNTSECGDPKGETDSAKNPFCDGIQVHVILDGWGQRNTFANNVLEVNAPGAGIWLQNTAVPQHNVIKCDNQVSGAGAGAYATDHYSPLACAP
jgi:hypothetical protein